MTLFSGADGIELRYFGAAHTNGDAFIMFRSAGVMHAAKPPGGNVVARNGGKRGGIQTTISRAAAGITGVHTVIPGHGKVATWQWFVDNAGPWPGHVTLRLDSATRRAVASPLGQAVAPDDEWSVPGRWTASPAIVRRCATGF